MSRSSRTAPQPHYDRAAVESSANAKYGEDYPEASPEERAGAADAIKSALDTLDALLARDVPLRTAGMMVARLFDHNEPRARMH